MNAQMTSPISDDLITHFSSLPPITSFTHLTYHFFHHYYSRALWLAALVDPEGVSSLVGLELRTRLREIFEANEIQTQGK
jgi:hypothetical protein